MTRPRLARRMALALVLALPWTALSQEAGPLEKGFLTPPNEARPMAWWHWINGNVTKEGIAADLEDMKRVGLGGAQAIDVEIYTPPGPVRYGTDNWHAHIQFAMQKAAELGLELDVANAPGWSASGGPWVTPERSMKKVVWSETETDGGAVSLSLPQPEAKMGFYRDIAVIAVPPTSERLPNLPAKINDAVKPVVRPPSTLPGISLDKVINLTGQMDASGKLTATLPPGRWTVLRFGFTTGGNTNHPAVPEGKGLEIDKLDADAVAFQFDKALGRIMSEAGPLAGKTFRGILFDSFEGGFQNWTDRFPALFTQQKGYDFIPFLPLITGRVIGSQELSEAVLWDFRQVIEELFTESYFGTMQKLAAAHGVKIYSESEGGPLNPLSMNRHVDFPMNEFWMPDTASRATRIKLTTSAAGFLGRTVIPSEAFTAKPEDGKYLAVPSTMKRPGDYAFTLGLNRFMLHQYSQQPVTAAAPGFTLGRYGTHFGRLITWWPYADAWIGYLSRCQFLLQQPGHTAADVCFLVDEDTGYGFPSKMADGLSGYNFDACYPPDLRAMSFRDGLWVHPQGEKYRLLVVPDAWVSEIATLQHIRDVVNAGGTLLGNPPTAPAGKRDVEARGEFDRLVAEIWGGLDGKKSKSKKLGGGMVFQGVKPIEVLQQQGVIPDFSVEASQGDFKYIHRTTADGDIYFVFNYSGDSKSVDLRFPRQDRQPEIWNPLTGTQVDAPVFGASKDGVSVPFQFEPWGSTFVLFRRALPKTWLASVTPSDLELANGTILCAGETATLRQSDGSEQTLIFPARPAEIAVAGPWQVAFPDGRGAPATSQFDKLVSWPDHPDPGIKYYSGTAVYQTILESPAPQPGQAAILDLGAVADIARVFVNDQPLGVLWKPPFRADVTRLLHGGTNTLRVEVANRWINRIIGDEAIPVDYKYQKAGAGKFTDGRLESLPDWLYDPSKLAQRRRYSFTTWKHYEADSPLVPSGLLGPVRIEWFNQVPLKGR